MDSVFKQGLQYDLKKIYKWAEDNLMVFNENKFEQLLYGETKNDDTAKYKNPLREEIKRDSKRPWSKNKQ